MKVVTKTCQECGNTYDISSQFATQSKYCSGNCKNTMARREELHKKYGQVTMVCENCGREFSIRRSMAKVQKYCSQECFGVAHRGMNTGEDNHKWKPKAIVICDYCGKEFETYPSRIGRKRYCCKAHHLLGNVRRLMGDKRTDIEIAMANAMTEAGIQFREQVVMFDKFQVDFLLSNNLIVQCDGLYWHSQPAAQRRDKGQDAYFRKCGYNVLRFTDKQIKNDIHGCITTILEFHPIAD